MQVCRGAWLILEKMSLVACRRELDQKEDEVEVLERIRGTEKRELMRGEGRVGATSQNWHGRTSDFFAVLSS